MPLFKKIINSELKVLFLLSLLFFVSFGVEGQNQVANPPARKLFPKPEVKNMLFYVQRTMNINTIIYELNVDAKDELDVKEPIKIYWISYAKKSEIESLNYIQRNYAYGLDVKIIDAVKKEFSFNLVSYKKQTLYLLKSATDNKYHVVTTLNGKLIILTHIFIQIEGGSFWFPKVKYIEVTGIDPAKNAEVVQRIIP